jgi:hypothetical protein
VLVLGAAVLLAACGGDDPAAPDAVAHTATTSSATKATATPFPTARPDVADAIDACALVTKAEIESAVSATVLDGAPEQMANLATCSYKDPDAPISTVAGLSVFAAASASDAREVFDLAKRNAADVQEVDGLGDDAYWDDILGTLQVLEGTYEVGIDVASDEGVDQRAAAKDIANKALSRLP